MSLEQGIENACMNAKMSKPMIEFKKRLDTEKGCRMTCKDFSMAAKAAVELAKKSEAHGGEEDDSYAEAFFTDVSEAYGGDTSDGEPFWVLATEWDTMLNDRTIGRISVNPIAHMAAIDERQWVNKSIVGHIDHKKDQEIDINVSDARWEFGKGLFLEVNPSVKRIYDGMKENIIKPSIEIRTFPDTGFSGKTANFYKAKGLGLMVDKNAMGINVGADNPDEEGSFAGGGDVMADEELSVEQIKTETGKWTEEGFEVPAIDETKSIEDNRKVFKDLTGKIEFARKQKKVLEKVDEDTKKDLTSILNKLEKLDNIDEIQKKVDEMVKANETPQEGWEADKVKMLKTIAELTTDNKTHEDKNKAFENILKDNYLTEKKYPKEIVTPPGKVYEDMSLDEIKVEVYRVDSIKKLALEGIADKDIEPWFGAKKDSEMKKDGRLTEKGKETLDVLLKNSNAVEGSMKERFKIN